MAMTPKAAVAALLVASLTAGCGSSGESSSEAEIEAACWAKRESIAAEMLVWAAMDKGTASALTGGLSGAKSYQIDRLRDSMPDC